MSGSVSLINGHIDPDKSRMTNYEKIKTMSIDEMVEFLEAEIERLTINMNAFGLGMKQEKERADTIRAEAIKEFAERLKEKKCHYTETEHTFDFDGVTVEDIDNLVKEMAGEDK